MATSSTHHANEHRFDLDRAGVLLGLGVIAALSWIYLFYQDWAMSQMDMADMAAPSSSVWGMTDVTLLFVMWVVMMAAMMLPSVTPMVLIFTRVNRQFQAQDKQFVRTWIFVAGYLSAWTGFSLLATLGQWALHAAALMTDMMATTSAILGGGVLIAAGVYQWTPATQVCLAHCRSPLTFLLSGWQSGAWGAYRMGITHGAYCTGCCWLLMALLFAVGVMNLAWIVGLSVFVLLEKTLPRGIWIARGSGVLLVALGGWMAITGGL
jgi:predicted metal-binding membrane protein